MNGKIVGGVIVGAAALVGAAIWYLQVYGFYDRVELAAGETPVELTSLASGLPEAIIADDFQAIDADSSPIRYRACFTTPMSQAMLSETYTPYLEAVPLTGPGWFDCYDAEEVGVALEEGRAIAFTGEQNIYYGIDRVVAIMDDGRGFVWHQINHCGEEVFDGNPPPQGCPDPEGYKAETPQESESNG
ncbi:DUF6446 family protein [Oceanicola sp. 502str15]|uniref:DUF6446 family protein n=1 Tax=Oceanicola sp. 502str15 TaxID=2696061 RepID=UPI0020941639|nr:DUF6446 family protein [Oceanicola sp. 502str15]MCO6382738.1 histidine kinase [Oceanicola sp. 502str15]